MVDIIFFSFFPLFFSSIFPQKNCIYKEVSFLFETRRCKIGCKHCPEIGQAVSGVGRDWLKCILQLWSRAEKTTLSKCIPVYVQSSTCGRKRIPLDSLLTRLGGGFVGAVLLSWHKFLDSVLDMDSQSLIGLGLCCAVGSREGMDSLRADCSWYWNKQLEWGLAYRWDYIICRYWHMLEEDKPL